MSLQYARLTARDWPALDGVIEQFLGETDVGTIEALSMGTGATNKPECRLFYREAE